MKLIATITAAILLSGCSGAKSQYYDRHTYQHQQYQQPVRDYRPYFFIQLHRYMHANINNQVNDRMMKVMLHYIDEAGMQRICEHNNCFLIYGRKKIVIKKEYIEITNGRQFLQTEDVHKAVEYIYY